MYQFICVLLFSIISIANCAPEHVRIVTVNITEVEDEERVVCASQNIQEKLTDGEQIQLVANIPYDTETFMWCHDDKQNVLSASCNHTGNQCTHLFQFSKQHGRWQCIYLMDTNRTIEPFEFYHGKKYTKAICELNLIAEESTSVATDIKEVDNGMKLECNNAQAKFMYGDPFQIITNTPYNIEYMWCDANKSTHNVLAATCSNAGNQCISLVRFGYTVWTSPGKWQCTYIMDTKGLVPPNVYVNGLKKYSKATCELHLEAEEYRTVALDIKVVNNGTRVECTSNKQDELMDGDLVHIIANVPYHVKTMSCKNERDDLIAVRCVQTGNQCYSAFTFNKSQRGRWQCSYTLRTKGAVEPVEVTRFGTKVTRATCELNLEVIDNRDITMDIKVVDNVTKPTESQP